MNTDKDRRRRVVDAARHSTAMEGGRCSDQALADQDAYVHGEITADELIARAGRASVSTEPDA